LARLSELPHGTVTFLFTDIVGSTRLWEGRADEMRDELARHDAVAKGSVDSHSGHVVKMTGDGLHAAFPTAREAVSAAIAMQDALKARASSASVPLTVRMGIHTCEAQLRDGDYFGSGVNRAARLMSVGNGGQILVSDVTAALLDGEFPAIDLGEHRLRDLSRAERVWQIGDDERFPPLQSLENLPGNLPVQLTEFVGRADDVERVSNALFAHRVVTLTGVGGVGKTRLALQVAADAVDRFRHGVWFCDLSPVVSADDVARTAADALGIDIGSTDTPEQALSAWLNDQERLIVLDNCEHVLDASARLVVELLASCPAVSVLATSREGLGAPGEQILTVRSLAVPPQRAGTEEIVLTEGVRLFIDRARLVRDELSLDGPSLDSIAEICRRTDGIPLAIELAAARMQSMSAREVAERLDRRFALLTRGNRRALGRHDTLQAAVDWSYQLLDDDERFVLARCSVFNGGFSLAAAEHLVDGTDVDRVDVLDILDSLVRRSMLLAEDVDGSTRYRLLETIRQYSAERLEESGDAAAARRAHLTWCRTFIEGCCIGLRGRDGRAWFMELDRELDNWRAAVSYATEMRQLDALVVLLGSVPALALYSTHIGTVFSATAVDVLATVGEPDHAVTGVLLALLSYDLYLRGEYEQAVEMGGRACEIVDREGAPLPTMPRGLLFASALFLTDFATALRIGDEHIAIGRATGDDYTVTEGFGIRSVALSYLGDADGATESARQALAGAAALGSPLQEMEAAFMAASVYVVAGDEPDKIRPMLETAIALATEFGNVFFASTAMGVAATIAAEAGPAAAGLRHSLELIRGLRHREAARATTHGISVVLLRAGRAEGAAVLRGVALTSPISTAALIGQVLDDQLVEALGTTAYEELTQRGRAMATDEALAFAISELDAMESDAARAT
jgi:predicted ATPase/class 3 adenylate cyclase